MNELMDEMLDGFVKDAATESFLKQKITLEITIDQACYLMAVIDVTLVQNKGWLEKHKDANEFAIKQIDKCEDELRKVKEQLKDKASPEKVGL